MARYIREVQLNRPDEFVQYIMTDFLSKHNFKLVEFKGEKLYRSGDGFFEMAKFLTWGYQNGVFHVEAWTRNCWLPGVWGKENALTGFMGCIPKGAYKDDIEALIGLMFQPIEQNQGMNPNPQQPVYVRGVDTSRYAVLALSFSLIGLVLNCLNGLLGLLFGTLAIIYGKRAMNSEKKGMATAGFVIGIIADVIGAVLLILSIVFAVMG